MGLGGHKASQMLRTGTALGALLCVAGCTWLSDEDWRSRTDVDEDGFELWEDCDDGDAAVSPDAVDVCDGLDNDCSGIVDDDPAQYSTWYLDRDQDDYGDPDQSTTGCEQLAAYVEVAGDCDDDDAALHPGADELCDEIDQDCDGEVDEDAVDTTTWYADLDGDGCGDETSSVSVCEGSTGYVAVAGDCDDGDAAVYPGADEICGDSVDENCDGSLTGCTVALTDADITLLGEGRSHEASNALSVAPDLNGDSFPDLIVSAPGEDSAGEDAGAAYVLFGPLSAGTSTLGATGGKVLASAADEVLGRSVAWIEDIDLDGLDEIALGAIHTTATKTEGGSVYVMLSPHTDTRDAAADAEIRLDGGKNYDHAGSRLLGGADFTGDAVADLVVGAWDAGGTVGTDNPGVVYIIDIAARPSSGSVLPTIAAATIEGDEGFDGLGSSLAYGDVSGDGVDDLLIGNETDWTAATDAGAVYLFEGPITGASMATDADFQYRGDAGDKAGRSVSVCDANEDGYGDVVAGATLGGDYLFSVSDPGVVWVVSSRDIGSNSFSEEADLTLVGVASDQEVGQHVDCRDDGDADEVPDLLVGAGGWPGDGSKEGGALILLHLASYAGAVEASDSGAILTGTASSDTGTTVAWMDVDGNGLHEPLVGAEGDDVAGTDAGALYGFLHMGW